ncbi:MAG: prepilin-type N-terminal cleavage/methylation domain-containing protein [Methylococcaceae bacterium]|nr:prepilin-type N-terminal cleavage/methylation domain-containing protein [Methylococcaceae bacterium]
MNAIKRHRKLGFTLIELLVIVAIVGITLSIGLPSLQSAIASNRLNASANDMVLALQTARSESIKQVHFAGVVFNADGSWDAVLVGTPNQVLQNYTAASGVILKVNAGIPNAGELIVRYRSDGRVVTGAPIVMEFTVNGSNEKRVLMLQPSGAVSQVSLEN